MQAAATGRARERARAAALRSVAPHNVPAAVVLAAAVVLLARWGPDWPAQQFRAWAAGQGALSLVTTRWYGGLPLPGYSVLTPALAAVIGPGALGVLSCAAISWGAAQLTPRLRGRRAVLFGLSVAVASAQSVLIGQVPFLLGAAFGVWALWALWATAHRKPVLAAVLAALCSLASPLAGAFLLLVTPPVALQFGVRRAAPLIAAGAGPLVAGVVGGAGGPFPCPWQSLAGVVGFTVAGLLVLPRDDRALRLFCWCYLAAAVAVFLIPDPVGGNITRLGKLIAMPLAVRFLLGTPRRPTRSLVLTVSVCILACAWPSVPFFTSIAEGAGDPARSPSYYTGCSGI